MTRRTGRSASVPPADSATAPAPWPPVWVFALIFLVTVLAYLPALSGGFIWDDAGHVTRPDLRSLEGLGRIWFEFGATQQYYPVLHSAFWIEHRLWGDASLGYHLLNVILHASAACLFFAVLRRLKVPGAIFAALLFALHPVCVESVAWISEQKNTLSLVFYLAAALAYLRFDSNRRGTHYVVALGFFILALLTKTVTATLPAALLVVFWWKRGRLEWRRDILPVIPWLVLGVISGLVTAHFERVLIGAQGGDFDLSLLERCLLAGRVFWFYLGKLAWPSDLVFIYPRWTVDASALWQWLFPLAGVALLCGLVWWRKRSRAPLAVALLFAGSLFPVLGFVNVFPFLFSYVADHFQYLASLPVFALAAAALASGATRLSVWTRYSTAAAMLAILGTLSWMQASVYRDEITLYETTLKRNPACWMAHNNLAIVLVANGKIHEAISHLETALRLKPDFALAENNLGDDLVQLDRAADAIPHLEHAISLQPDYAMAHRNLGIAFALQNRNAEAISQFETALKIDPYFAEAEMNLAVALMLTGRFAEAVPHFDKAVALSPDSIEIHHTYGRALMNEGKLDAAVREFERTIQLNPNFAEAHMDLAAALHKLGREKESRIHYAEAVRLDPSLAHRP